MCNVANVFPNNKQKHMFHGQWLEEIFKTFIAQTLKNMKCLKPNQLFCFSQVLAKIYRPKHVELESPVCVT